MSTKRLVPILAALLVALTAREASAVWVQSRLTPHGLNDGERAFTVKQEMREGLKQFSVTVTPKGKPLSPFANGQLQVIQGDRTVAIMPVTGTWKKGSVSFWFRVSPEALAHSRFDYAEQAYVKAERGEGEPAPDPERTGRYEMTLGGQAWYFFLSDFAEAGEPPKS
jgi:hypothetical protein